MIYTIEDKYKFLCSLLKVVAIDYLEGDALLAMPGNNYFQFPIEEITDQKMQDTLDVDKAVERLMGYNL